MNVESVPLGNNELSRANEEALNPESSLAFAHGLTIVGLFPLVGGPIAAGAQVALDQDAWQGYIDAGLRRLETQQGMSGINARLGQLDADDAAAKKAHDKKDPASKGKYLVRVTDIYDTATIRTAVHHKDYFQSGCEAAGFMMVNNLSGTDSPPPHSKQFHSGGEEK